MCLRYTLWKLTIYNIFIGSIGYGFHTIWNLRKFLSLIIIIILLPYENIRSKHQLVPFIEYKGKILTYERWIHMLHCRWFAYGRAFQIENQNYLRRIRCRYPCIWRKLFVRMFILHTMYFHIPFNFQNCRYINLNNVCSSNSSATGIESFYYIYRHLIRL